MPRDAIELFNESDMNDDYLVASTWAKKYRDRAYWLKQRGKRVRQCRFFTKLMNLELSAEYNN
ncbi:MAG: hypothetical protein Fur006_14950 [Coleofasciculaceae cyanobacterium]